MDIAILGGGITGLGIGRLLNKKHKVQIFEKKAVVGGIARTRDVGGMAYHVVGGHCFNSKYEDVLKFVFEEVLPLSEWHKVERKSSIQLNNHEIDYPIEFSVKDIYKFDKELAIKITADFLSAEDDGKYLHLDEWFRKKFGNTLAEEYFIPYNTKIWNNNLKEMSSAWVEDKLPIPNKNSFFEGLIDSQKDTMAHASFYYPNSNNQNTFIDALALGLDIKYNTDISSISYINDTKKWIINNEFVFDHIINTTPIDLLPFVMDNVPEMVLNAAKKLKYNSISNVLWKTKWTDKTWTYYPKDKIFHRYIHIGGFHLPKQGYTITEVVGKFSYDDMKKDGASDDFLVEPLDYNVSEHAYVVFDENYESATTIVKSYLAESGIDSIGRFGEWQYYNMDVCIKRSIDLAKKFL